MKKFFKNGDKRGNVKKHISGSSGGLKTHCESLEDYTALATQANQSKSNQTNCLNKHKYVLSSKLKKSSCFSNKSLNKGYKKRFNKLNKSNTAFDVVNEVLNFKNIKISASSQEVKNFSNRSKGEVTQNNEDMANKSLVIYKPTDIQKKLETIEINSIFNENKNSQDVLSESSVNKTLNLMNQSFEQDSILNKNFLAENNNFFEKENFCGADNGLNGNFKNKREKFSLENLRMIKKEMFKSKSFKNISLNNEDDDKILKIILKEINLISKKIIEILKSISKYISIKKILLIMTKNSNELGKIIMKSIEDALKNKTGKTNNKPVAKPEISRLIESCKGEPSSHKGFILAYLNIRGELNSFKEAKNVIIHVFNMKPYDFGGLTRNLFNKKFSFLIDYDAFVEYQKTRPNHEAGSITPWNKNELIIHLPSATLISSNVSSNSSNKELKRAAMHLLKLLSNNDVESASNFVIEGHLVSNNQEILL